MVYYICGFFSFFQPTVAVSAGAIVLIYKTPTIMVSICCMCGKIYFYQMDNIRDFTAENVIKFNKHVLQLKLIFLS